MLKIQNNDLIIKCNNFAFFLSINLDFFTQVGYVLPINVIESSYLGNLYGWLNIKAVFYQR